MPVPEPGPVLAPEQVRADALAPARAWWNRRPRGRTPWLAGLGVALVVVLALVGYLAAVTINNTRYPPDQPVRALFAALTARDTTTAAELAGCTSPACTGNALSRGYEPPTDVQLGKISYSDPTDNTRRPDKSIAYVPVTYRLGGAAQTVTMRVQRTGTGLARPFRIMSGATGRLAVTAGRLDQVQVAGAQVPVDDQGVTVLPGRYTVQVPPTDPLFAATPAAPAQVDVPATADQRATPVALQLPVQIRPDVVDQVDEQVAAFLAACAEQETLTPAGCPFRVPGIVISATDVRWRIDQAPVIEVVPAEQPGPTDPPAAMRTITPGRVTVTYAAFTSAGGDRSTVTQQLPIEITGTVDVDPALPGRIIWSG
ncbi:hypothetical protein ACQP2Y_46910 (plasmid) [Actinoplanes sp. CA-051413]|uniref:hypothetical protein n=1 Tax=Actinoplanes sp. CA-051413 TaxID=3239899 RepID=UPI003D95341E